MAIGRTLALAREGFLEAVWPTRCALCDVPGRLLCDRCRVRLPYLDSLRACPACGAPWGALECSECNSFMAKRRAQEERVLDRCASLLVATPQTLSMVALYKDRNERRLGPLLGAMLGEALPRHWVRAADSKTVMTWIPARRLSARQRGFDHAQLLAEACARTTGCPCVSLLSVTQRKDQRLLDAKGRARNMRQAFTATESARELAGSAKSPTSRTEAGAEAHDSPTVIVVDDVFTTGATLDGAARALKEAGFARVLGATVLRVL